MVICSHNKLGRNEGRESFTPLESWVSFNREDVALEMIETAKKHNQEVIFYANT